ncbi:MAG: hypothetical protein H0X24_23265 [Ktedonobacterales bacterium]|nr:hypothetical protein [Ktedonobacterales bacterium]
MGKLIDTLQRAGRSTGGAIGFLGQGGGPKAKAAAILVTASDVKSIAALVAAGADAVILPAGADLAGTKDAGVAVGVDARQAPTFTGDALKALHEQGADFVLLAANAPVRALTEEIEHFDRALLVAPPTDDPLLIAFRALNVLDVEVGVLDLQLRAKDLTSLTVQEYARLRLLSESLRFPVIVTLAEMPAPDDVRTLARLGAQGVWLADATPATITTLREELERVPREKTPVPGIAGLTNPGSTAGR